MPLIPIMHKFVPMIESGRKIHTIRKERKNPFRVGQTLFFYTDSRTPGAKFQFERVVSNVYHVSIDPLRLKMALDGVSMTMRQINDLTYHDGFDQVTDFFKFFERYPSDVCKNDLRLVCWAMPIYLLQGA